MDSLHLPVSASASPSIAAPTQPQIYRLAQFGITSIPSTRSEASKLISEMIAKRDTVPATKPQIGRAGVMGGRDLPGASIREKSTQIYLLEALVLLDQAQNDDATDVAINMLIDRVRERLQKPNAQVKVTAAVAPSNLPDFDTSVNPF